MSSVDCDAINAVSILKFGSTKQQSGGIQRTRSVISADFQVSVEFVKLMIRLFILQFGGKIGQRSVLIIVVFGRWQRRSKFQIRFAV